MIDYLGIVYAIVVAIGGIIGYVKAGSTPSLIAGLIFGALIGVGAFLSSRDPPFFFFSLAVALVLGGFMGWRFYASTWKFMPSGLIFILSLGMASWYAVKIYLAMNEEAHKI